MSHALFKRRSNHPIVPIVYRMDHGEITYCDTCHYPIERTAKGGWTHEGSKPIADKYLLENRHDNGA